MSQTAILRVPFICTFPNDKYQLISKRHICLFHHCYMQLRPVATAFVQTRHMCASRDWCARLPSVTGHFPPCRGQSASDPFMDFFLGFVIVPSRLKTTSTFSTCQYVPSLLIKSAGIFRCDILKMIRNVTIPPNTIIPAACCAATSAETNCCILILWIQA